MSNSPESKYERLRNTIVPILKCIRCNQTQLILQDSATTLLCPKCTQEYRVHNGIPIMTLYPEAAVAYPQSAMVEHEYSQQWIALIEKAQPGLVLDFGSGNSPDIHQNLIKMEIFAFPNVDVVGFGERVPFADNTFQAVFSGAVFEHVENPFACASEIYNILKEDGEIYIETAFLQPFHAYPNHYFNMTTQGLRKVMSSFKELEVGVQPHQNPSFMLSWVLDVWAHKLSEEEREDFFQASLSDVLNEYKNNVFSQRWMANFTERDKEELACGVYFHGKKQASINEPNVYEESKLLRGMLEQKNEHIRNLESLIARIEQGYMMRFMNWLRTLLP